MAGRPYVLAECLWGSVRETEYSVAVLPWGATEPHNYHLPYATDNYQSEAIAMEAARLAWERGARVIVLPGIPFGVNTGQLDLKLCINMNPSTQLAVLRDVVDSLIRSGVQKLVLVNGHGGNDFKPLLRELQGARPECLLSTVNWFQAAPAKDYFHEPGDHAGELETSTMLCLRADLVAPLGTAGDGATRRWRLTGLKDGWAWSQRQWTQVSTDTGVGDPRRATAEKGAAFAAVTAERISQFLVELAACRLDELYE